MNALKYMGEFEKPWRSGQSGPIHDCPKQTWEKGHCADVYILWEMWTELMMSSVNGMEAL